MMRDFALVLGLAASICVGLAFVVAAIGKLRHRDILPGVIANYRLLPEGLVGPAAAVLPWAELVIGAALLLGERRFAPLLAIALLLVFAAAMAINLLRGRHAIDCGCGLSVLRQQLRWPLVARNLVLAAMLVPQLLPGAAMDLAATAIASAAGVALFLVYLLFNSLVALAAPIHAHRA